MNEDEDVAEFLEPLEGDLVTEDHVRFWQYGMNRRKPVVTTTEEDWRPAVKLWMDQQQYWPSVWWISDHGNAHLLRLEDK